MAGSMLSLALYILRLYRERLEVAFHTLTKVRKLTSNSVWDEEIFIIYYRIAMLQPIERLT